MCIPLPLPPRPPSPDTTSRHTDQSHLHKGLKRELTEQGRWYRPINTQEGGHTGTVSHFSDTCGCRGTLKPVQRRSWAWAEGQFNLRGQCWENAFLTAKGVKWTWRNKKRIIWHLQLIGKLNLRWAFFSRIRWLNVDLLNVFNNFFALKTD